MKYHISTNLDHKGKYLDFLVDISAWVKIYSVILQKSRIIGKQNLALVPKLQLCNHINILTYEHLSHLDVFITYTLNTSK